MTCMVLNTFTARLQRLVGLKSKRNSHTLHISAPFNFKHESISLPGLSEDDIATLKEKAAATRLGAGDNSNESSSAFGSPRKAHRATPSPARPAVLDTPGTSLSPEDNVF
ncbi:hypothetical protein F4801DRAFT_93520 [Xylaria longipes]|nr:hypothetical protein F4801DRAFT_93520 [Xylaria longipes]RYC61823.1 hypothetical protein CHU98_g4387 [Xylaria longipes]